MYRLIADLGSCGEVVGCVGDGAISIPTREVLDLDSTCNGIPVPHSPVHIHTQLQSIHYTKTI